MALTAAEFVAVRGEFTPVYETDPARVTAALAAAYRSTDATLYGDDTDEAAMWLAAHLLTADPLGKDARVVGKKAQDTTLYMRERLRYETIYCSCVGLTL